MVLITQTVEKTPMRAWAAALIGFMFLLRGIELAALELRDVTIGRSDAVGYVRGFIRKSKTDQEER